MVVLGVVLHGGEVNCLVRQHAVRLVPARTKARLLAMDVTFHLDSLFRQLLHRFVYGQGFAVSLLLQGGGVRLPVGRLLHHDARYVFWFRC